MASLPALLVGTGAVPLEGSARCGVGECPKVLSVPVGWPPRLALSGPAIMLAKLRQMVASRRPHFQRI